MDDVFTWYQMKFWESGEWQKIQEDLDALDTKKILYCPGYDRLFAALDATSFGEVKVAIIGQDPYPNIEHATGIAFDVPSSAKTVPATLGNIFTEYCADLHYPYPTSTSLVPWTKQGVLLWNAIPTCLVNNPGSHHGWTEWTWLTKEIVEVLDTKGVVLVFMGGIARSYVQYVKNTKYLEYTHPSPRGQMKKGGYRFLGSRMFTTINDKLNELKLGSVYWKLP
jgi:uracil-DNA glycosylase